MTCSSAACRARPGRGPRRGGAPSPGRRPCRPSSAGRGPRTAGGRRAARTGPAARRGRTRSRARARAPRSPAGRSRSSTSRHSASASRPRGRCALERCWRRSRNVSRRSSQRGDHAVGLDRVDQRAVRRDADDQVGVRLARGADIAREHVVLAAAVAAQAEAAGEVDERVVGGVRRSPRGRPRRPPAARQPLELALEQRPAGQVHQDLARQPRRGHARLDDHDPAHRAHSTADRRIWPRLSPVRLARAPTWISTARPSSSPARPARSAPRSSATVLARYDVAAIRAFSRDELKQSELGAGASATSRIRLLLGDVRDLRAAAARHPRRRPDRPRRRAQAGAGVRVQPVRGGADEHRRRPERDLGGDRQRRRR